MNIIFLVIGALVSTGIFQIVHRVSLEGGADPRTATIWAVIALGVFLAFLDRDSGCKN